MYIEKPNRNFVAKDCIVQSWDSIKSYFESLDQRLIENQEDAQHWLRDRSELEAFLEEDLAWRYIKMSIDTNNKEKVDAYTKFVTEIQPQMAPFDDRLNRKMVENSHIMNLSSDAAHAIYFRSIKSALSIFRQDNISIEAYLNEKAQEFGAISAAQSIVHEGKTLTMQQASQFLKDPKEEVRKEVFEKMAERRREDCQKLDDLFSDLLVKRHELAVNAGFQNFRDYKFVAMGRFDYSKEDCFAFHEAIKQEVVPLVKAIQLRKLEQLGKSHFKPWDLEVDPKGRKPLKPFESGEEMLTGTIAMFKRLDPYFADCIDTMKEMGHLDLDSKHGKAPGGYNYPLYEIGVPFIFMNAVGAHRDLVTMVHEAGHAVHSFLSRDLQLTAFKNFPSEVAELASMSMELLSMDLWDEFYPITEELNRAKQEHLEDILKILPWIAQIDAFQHWIYTNPTHNIKERHTQWMKLSTDYGTGLVDWKGFEDLRETSWQRQLHLFEVPFYYIEYGIAQLGALGVWMNSLQDKDNALTSYKHALSLGYTQSLPEIYQAASVPFDFSVNRLKLLVENIKRYLEKLN
jgi:oligoendopeptidase F